VTFLGKKETDALLRDAIYQHLIGQGYSDYQAEAESKRRLEQLNDL